MKIRKGFVSNSSSSSFCILGVSLTDDIRNKLKEIAENKYLKNGIEFPSNWEDDFTYIAEYCGFEYYDEYKSDYGKIIGKCILGMSPEDIIKCHKKLIEDFGDLNFSVKSGDYYS